MTTGEDMKKYLDIDDGVAAALNNSDIHPGDPVFVEVADEWQRAKYTRSDGVPCWFDIPEDIAQFEITEWVEENR